MTYLEKTIKDKSPEEIYDILYWLMFTYGRQFINSPLAIINWIKDGEWKITKKE